MAFVLLTDLVPLPSLNSWWVSLACSLSFAWFVLLSVHYREWALFIGLVSFAVLTVFPLTLDRMWVPLAQTYFCYPDWCFSISLVGDYPSLVHTVLLQLSLTHFLNARMWVHLLLNSHVLISLFPCPADLILHPTTICCQCTVVFILLSWSYWCVFSDPWCLVIIHLMQWLVYHISALCLWNF
jgi:hypothetical protein